MSQPLNSGPLNGQSSEQAKLEFTASAARRVAKLRDLEKKADLMLRLSVQGGGCSGFSYKFDFEQDSTDDDTIIEKNGVQLVVDSMSLEFLSGAKVDFVEELIGASFRVTNPNATASCGCGTSFTVL